MVSRFFKKKRKLEDLSRTDRYIGNTSVGDIGGHKGYGVKDIYGGSSIEKKLPSNEKIITPPVKLGNGQINLKKFVVALASCLMFLLMH